MASSYSLNVHDLAGSISPCLGLSRRNRRCSPSSSVSKQKTGSTPSPPNDSGRRILGRLLGVAGATDIPPAPGCTQPCSSTGISHTTRFAGEPTCFGRTPKYRPERPTCGSLRKSAFIARKTCILPHFVAYPYAAKNIRVSFRFDNDVPPYAIL